MIEYLPSITLIGLIAVVIVIIGAIMIGLYFMAKKLIAYNASLRNQNKDD
ncbi:hypothetical protein [Gudongella sp. SC589]|jgi:uncharacterized membrane-anchored protein